MMADIEALRARIEELAERDWDVTAIEARFNKLLQRGVLQKSLDREDLTLRRAKILDRVQRRAEEYCYLTRNCAKGSATALLEEFGLGNMEIIKALTPFPGIGMRGGTCGAVTGGLIALGLFFASEDATDHQDPAPYLASREFTQRVEEAFGSLLCAEIQEFILGKYYDPLDSLENLEAFNRSNAREKCPLAPGLGARIAAEIIIESMERG